MFALIVGLILLSAWHWAGGGLVTLLAGGILTALGVVMLAAAWYDVVHAKQQEDEAKKLLAGDIATLALEEKRILLCILRAGQRSIVGDSHNGYAHALVYKGLLNREAEGQYRGKASYTVPSKAWDVLTETYAAGKLHWEDAEQGLAAWEEQFRRGPRSWA